MKTGTCENYARREHEDITMNSVIYLYDPKKVRARRKKHNSDVFWNVLFSGLCLSVLVILFLH